MTQIHGWATVVLLGMSVCAGCGGAASNGGSPPASLTVSPTQATVAVGGTQQFTANMAVNWSVSGQGCTSSDCGTIDATGKFTAPQTAPNPNAVTVTATSTSNHVATATVTITAPASPTCSISADPSTILSGTSSTLAWTGTNATSASLDNGIGAVATSGSKPVSPAATTTYTLTVQNSSGSGKCSTLVTVNQPWTIGNGSFTKLQFTSNIPAADQAYITSLYTVAYPLFIQQFGPPPDVSALTIDLCSWSYGADTHTLCVSVLPTAPGMDQNSWDAVFLHELGGAMWLSQHTGVGSNWIAEAVGDIGTVLGQRVTGLKGQAFFGNELDYDVLSLGGKEIVGGIPGKAWTSVLQHAGLNEESAKELLQILVGSQSIAAVGDWPNYNALKDLKTALYAKANACQCTLQDSDVFAALSVYSQPIEGTLPDVWVPLQPVAYTLGTPGTYAYVYASPAANPSYLEAVCFTRTGQQVPGAPPGTLQENSCTSGTLTITVSNPNGTVQTVNLDLSSASHELNFDTTKFALGSYRIQASGTANGTSATAPDSYFGIFDKTLALPGQDIGTLPNALFLIGKNADGTPSVKTFPAPTGGTSGTFLENGNGVAIWQVNASTIPQPEYTELGRQLYVPLPFSPVFVLDNQ